MQTSPVISLQDVLILHAVNDAVKAFKLLPQSIKSAIECQTTLVEFTARVIVTLERILQGKGRENDEMVAVYGSPASYLLRDAERRLGSKVDSLDWLDGGTLENLSEGRYP